MLDTKLIYGKGHQDAFKKEMKNAVEAYLRAGGKIIFSTGLPADEVKKHLFQYTNQIADEFK